MIFHGAKSKGKQLKNGENLDKGVEETKSGAGSIPSFNDIVSGTV